MPYVYVPSDDESNSKKFNDRIDKRRSNRISKNKKSSRKSTGSIVKHSKSSRVSSEDIKFAALKEEIASVLETYDELDSIDLSEVEQDTDFLVFLAENIEAVLDRLDILYETVDEKADRKLRKLIGAYMNVVNDKLNTIYELLAAEDEDCEECDRCGLDVNDESLDSDAVADFLANAEEESDSDT
ncbi:hypothetical protein DASB73_018860 [Starmerella bacillaris]|uniref:Uncharacterized protein n=1 Tax=Starmerella bacillaris TaxID=1247836 RepID=A0AAV5RHJ9_STABA|nr:hypothetical protein DASB73_018860 [Starmerella bacillaris]